MITDRYRELVNAMRSKNGMAPAFPSSAAAPDLVDATDEDNDGGALELLRRGVQIANREPRTTPTTRRTNFRRSAPMLSLRGVSHAYKRTSPRILPPTRGAPRWRRTWRLSSSTVTKGGVDEMTTVTEMLRVVSTCRTPTKRAACAILSCRSTANFARHPRANLRAAFGFAGRFFASLSPLAASTPSTGSTPPIGA